MTKNSRTGDKGAWLEQASRQPGKPKSLPFQAWFFMLRTTSIRQLEPVTKTRGARCAGAGVAVALVILVCPDMLGPFIPQACAEKPDLTARGADRAGGTSLGAAGSTYQYSAVGRSHISDDGDATVRVTTQPSLAHAEPGIVQTSAMQAQNPFGDLLQTLTDKTRSPAPAGPRVKDPNVWFG